MKPIDLNNLPPGAIAFNLAPGAGKQPAFPVLPPDLASIPTENLMDVANIAPLFLMIYVENDQVEESKALVATMRRIGADLAVRAEMAAETCDCENCVAGRKARDEAVTAIATARGVPPKAVNNDGETLH